MRVELFALALSLPFALAPEAARAQVAPLEITDLEATNRQLQALQEAFAAERAHTDAALRRILRRRIVVPPPGSAPERVESVREAWAAVVPPTVTGRIALVAQTEIGPAQGPIASWTRSRGLTLSVNDPEVAFGDEIRWETEDDVSLGLAVGACSFQQNHDSERSVEITTGNAWLGLSRKGETYGLSAGSGLAFDAARMLRFKVGLEESVSVSWAEEYVRGFGHAVALTGRTAWASGKRAARAVLASLREATPCMYCAALGALSCPQCADARTITCPTCAGSGDQTCSRCGGGGLLDCPTTESCSGCGGSGCDDCGTCGGSGRVTDYEEYTEWRRVLLPGGFDSAGNPIYCEEYQSFPATRTVQVTCGSCGGSGHGGACGTCGGSGNVVCSRCEGSGNVYCGRCSGTGREACGECDGARVVTCPLCRGSELVCPLCQGARRLLPRGGR
ncbi:MAG: hypothetical protein IPM29_06590 [Planctomycetes bacterium]|nr:hypothetical protein [Planctomycetota bacterium]